MALIATVEKQGVSLRMPKCWLFTFNLILNEGENVVLERTFSATYKQGQDVAIITASLIVQMQAAINQYKKEQELFNTVALDNVVVAINSGLETE